MPSKLSRGYSKRHVKQAPAPTRVKMSRFLVFGFWILVTISDREAMVVCLTVDKYLDQLVPYSASEFL